MVQKAAKVAPSSRKKSVPRTRTDVTRTQRLKPTAAQRLLKEKLNNPNKHLKDEEKIMLMSHCLLQGRERAQQAAGKNVVFVIGNTGAGKSTFINYMCGCEMVEKRRKDLGMKGMGKVIVAAGSAVAIIGHETQKSATFLPMIAYDEKTDTVYCDCPGFLDNRGAEINIANAVNIRATISNAKSVKIVTLINYYSISADRGRGLQETMRTLATMFGTEAAMLEHQSSVLLGVTRYPRMEELEDLRDEITDGPFGETEVTKQLVARLFVYDALDREFENDSGLKREALLAEMKSMPVITDAANIFKMVLTAQDDLELRTLCTAVSERTQGHLQQKEWRKATDCAKALLQLKPIGHPSVDQQLQLSRMRFERHFGQLSSDCLIAISDERFDEAERMIQELEEAVGEFKTAELVTEEQEVANVATLRQQLDGRKQGVETRRRDLEQARNDLKRMAELYAEEKKLGEERYEKEKAEQLDIEQRLQQHTEALENQSTSWFTSSKKTEAALVKLEGERAEQVRRAEEEREQYKADHERKMAERDKEHERQMAEIQAKLDGTEGKR
jgi:energy-coupling factor transporter ATP-binding protein EcfA2